MENKATTPTPAAPKKEEKKDNRRFLIILIFLLLISNIGLGVLYWLEHQRKNEVIVEKEQVIVERTNIKQELEQLQTEYGDLQTNDKKIQSELEEKKAQIAQMIVEAEKHKDDSRIIGKLKRETETLRKIMKSYVATIDSLNTLNQTLVVEKEKVRTELTHEQSKSSQLAKEKDELKGVVRLGSVLKANNMRATGVKIKSGGKKEVETTKAKRSDKLKVSFILSENKIAQKGSKDIFLRCITPDGKELARAMDDANSFSFNGVKGFFCAKRTVSYENQELPLDLYAEMVSGFIPGKYILEVYADEALIGQVTLTLD